MHKKIKRFFYAVPTPLAGLALGIASLGIGLENTLSLDNLVQFFSAILSMILVCILLGKYILHPQMLKDDVAHPVVGSILPTIAMALMLQTKTISFVSQTAAELVWLFAVFLHFALMFGFVFHRVRDFSLKQMVPSWFVPFVGIGVAAVTVPNGVYHDLAYAIFVFGLINYAIILPIMVYRLIFAEEINDNFKPTIAILAAPASLSLMAYLSLEQNPSLLLCSILFGIAILMTVIIYIAFFKLLRLPFSPGFAAYTFPMAVGAASLIKVSEVLATYPLLIQYSWEVHVMGIIEMVIATCVCIYVVVSFILYYVRAWKSIVMARRAANMDDECFDDECLECFSKC